MYRFIFTNWILLLICFTNIWHISLQEIFFKEEFKSDLEFSRDWIISNATVSDSERTRKYEGNWVVGAHPNGMFEGNNVLVANTPSGHYSASRKLENIFKFIGKPLIVQYEFLFPVTMSCGGAYIKLLSDYESNDDLSKVSDSSPYTIMFGPDICGGDKKIHFIFRHLNPITNLFEEKHLNQPDSMTFSHIFNDGKLHHLLLQVNPDNSFVIQLDGLKLTSGSLLTHFTPSVNPPEFIEDPNHHKPQDWDDRQKIPDPDDVKPVDWDDSAPLTIPDPNVVMPDGWMVDEPSRIPDPSDIKPADWNDEIDGEWTPSSIENPSCSVGCGPWKPPQIPNPDYKGEWSPRLIDNPNFKGNFKPQQIKNPDFFSDSDPYKMTDISAISFELWIVSNGVSFDNLMITDDIAYSKNFASKILSYRAHAYKMKKLMDIVNSKLTLKILSAIFGGLVFIIFIYYKFLRGSNKDTSQKNENVEVKSSESDEHAPEDEEPSTTDSACDESSKDG